MLEELYQEIILDHYRRPRNKGRATPADLQAKEYNPLCGDEIEITVTVAEGKITALKFDGHGCSISQASASIMTQKLIGKTPAEAGSFIGTFLEMMRGETPFGGKELGDLKALEGVLKFPVRVKCATLAWHTALKAVAETKATGAATLMHQYSRHFSVDEARAAIPLLRNVFTDVHCLRDRLHLADEKLGHQLQKTRCDLGGTVVNGMLRDLAEVNGRLRELIEMGIVIKDVDRGLVDFPHLRDGHEVFLCWELDEDDIEFWHDLDTGYAGRERI